MRDRKYEYIFSSHKNVICSNGRVHHIDNIDSVLLSEKSSSLLLLLFWYNGQNIAVLKMTKAISVKGSKVRHVRCPWLYYNDAVYVITFKCVWFTQFLFFFFSFYTMCHFISVYRLQCNFNVFFFSVHLTICFEKTGYFMLTMNKE